jgi:hypothetical protein
VFICLNFIIIFFILDFYVIFRYSEAFFHKSVDVQYDLLYIIETMTFRY